MSDERLAEIAYSAYGGVVEFKNVRGEPMPMWAALPQKIRDAWISAANAVKQQIVSDVSRG